MKESGITCLIVLLLGGGAQAADLSQVLPTKTPLPAAVPVAYDWNGFYVGGHLGYAGGSSRWSAPGASGSFELCQGFNAFNDTGSYFEGLQAGPVTEAERRKL